MRYIFPVLMFCVPLGIYSLMDSWNVASNAGAISDRIAIDPGTGITVYAKGNGYLAEAQLMLATSGALLAWAFRFRLVSIAPLLAFVVFRAGTGGRGPFVIALLAVGLLYLYENRMRLPSAQVAVVLVIAISMFNIVGSDRGRAIRQAISNNDNSYVSKNVNQLKPLEGMDFANLEFFEYLVYAIPQRTHTYGYFLDNLQIFTEPIPRALWKDKPVGAPFNRIFLMDYGRNYGMTRSLPGQGWYSLGWVGVIIWCGLWGYALGYIYRRFVDGSQSSFLVLSYCMFVATLAIDYRDGQIVTILRQCLFYLTPILLFYFVSSVFRAPSMENIRAVLIRRRRTRIEYAVDGERDMEARRSVSSLPPAVQRRRAALAEAER